MLNLTTDQFHYQEDESSISLKNLVTWLTKTFYFYIFDKTPSGEVARWRYESGDLKLLIINN